MISIIVGWTSGGVAFNTDWISSSRCSGVEMARIPGNQCPSLGAFVIDLAFPTDRYTARLLGHFGHASTPGGEAIMTVPGIAGCCIPGLSDRKGFLCPSFSSFCVNSRLLRSFGITLLLPPSRKRQPQK